MLLIGQGFMIRSFIKLQQVDARLQSGHLFTIAFEPKFFPLQDAGTVRHALVTTFCETPETWVEWSQSHSHQNFLQSERSWSPGPGNSILKLKADVV